MRIIIILLALAALVMDARAAPIDDLTGAAYRNNGRELSALLARGVDPNARDAQGNTALEVALREESAKALESLLVHPALDVNQANAAGETPLMLAALKGRLDWVKQLVKKGALINRDGWTPLHYACSGPDNGVAAWLIEQGAEINARSDNGTTPLMMAARYGNGDLVPMLLQAGAEPRAANEQELTAADFAQRGGRDRIAAELRRISAERQRAADAAK